MLTRTLVSGRAGPRRAALVALVLVPAAVGLAVWAAARGPWLRVAPVRGPIPDGDLLIPAQRAPMHISFAPDGTPIVDVSAGGIVRVDPRDGSSRVVVPMIVQEVRPSPDGRMLAFVTYHPRGQQVWVTPSDGSGEPRRVPGLSGTPVWSPDGRALACTNMGLGGHPPDRVGAGGTVRVDLSDMTLTPLDLPPTEAIRDWSADGRSLLTVSTRGYAPKRASWEIYRMTPDGSDSVRLSDGGSSFFARFAPDGRRVAYIRDEADSASVWVVAADGSGRRRLVDGLKDNVLACWSPDGTALVVSTRHSVEIVAADGSWRRPLDLSIRPLRPMLRLPWGDGSTGLAGVEWLPPRPRPGASRP